MFDMRGEAVEAGRLPDMRYRYPVVSRDHSNVELLLQPGIGACEATGSYRSADSIAPMFKSE